MTTNSVSLHTARKIFIYLLTYLLIYRDFTQYSRAKPVRWPWYWSSAYTRWLAMLELTGSCPHTAVFTSELTSRTSNGLCAIAVIYMWFVNVRGDIL